MRRCWRKEYLLDQTWHGVCVLLISTKRTREGVLHHLALSGVQKCHCIRLLRCRRTSPPRWLLWLVIFLSWWCLCSLLFLIIFSLARVKLAKRYFYISSSLGVKFIRRRVELLHNRLTWDLWQLIFKPFKNFVEINLEVCLFLGLLLQKLLEFILFLIDLEPVHLIFAITQPVQIILFIVFASSFDIKASCEALSLCEVIFEGLIFASLLWDCTKLELKNEKLFYLLMRDG